MGHRRRRSTLNLGMPLQKLDPKGKGLQDRRARISPLLRPFLYVGQENAVGLVSPKITARISHDSISD